MIQIKLFKYTGLIFSALTVSACSSFGYYMDLMAGHSELMEQQKPVAEILATKGTRPELRHLLEKSQSMRDFASKNLHLPENDSYRTYADLKRPYAVWNVVAAKEFSTKAKKWCFLFVGCLSYKGYFSKEEAVAYAEELKKEGYDVYVAGANAYSTLGWFDDPLLNTMMYKSEARRAGIIFHELAHQVVYIDNDSAFNEAFATTVEQEGIRRWLVRNGENNKYKEYLIDKSRDAQFNQLLQQTRERLKAVYKRNTIDQEKRIAKQQAFAHLQRDYQKLKNSWGGYNAYDKWMSQELNNSHLLLIATYYDLVPAFTALLNKENNDLKKFYIAVEQFGQLDKEKRDKQLFKFT
ncbi:MAG: aminopeptidase, partial [Gammaproteobacteria bacterium]|nr:aminopeptidase [Gammaproteobacteria bacterium]